MKPSQDVTVIWAHCTEPAHLPQIAMLEAQLHEDGDPVSFVRTLPKTHAVGDVIPQPENLRDVRALLNAYAPNLVLWMDGPLRAVTLNTCASRDIPVIAVNARASALNGLAGRWIPGRWRASLAPFHTVFAVDDIAAQAFTKAGIDPKRVVVAAPLEDLPDIPPLNAQVQKKLSEQFGTRPIWLATRPNSNEIPAILQAHKQATRRAYRLLLVIQPSDAAQVDEIRAACAESVMAVATDEDLNEATQVFLAPHDTHEAIWQRLSPISFLGGSLDGGLKMDPFLPAALGSVVVHGPRAGAHQPHLLQLVQAGATYGVSTPARLGATIEELLIADVVAHKATLGWDVVSRGAEMANRLVGLIRQSIDGELV